MLTLLDALQRIERSAATNEGPDTKVEMFGRIRPVRDWCLDRSVANYADEVRLVRSLRNWSIVCGDVVIAKVNPWDETENVARMVTERTLSVESVTAFVGRVESLARDAESLFAERQPAAHLMALSVWARRAVGLPVENALREQSRLTNGG